MNQELRLYSFVNFYLSSIQQGIQTGHMAVDMLRRYKLSQGTAKEQHDIVVDWADNHKTFIVLNGGDSANVEAIFQNLWDICNKLNLPFCKFDEPGCKNMMTCCGVILPAKYFNAKVDSVTNTKDFFYKEDVTSFHMSRYVYMTPEWELINILKSCQLAK